ncbi:hypothetical protein [Streptomyces tirandamycinicus]|uniref:Uncharacterized protein n=1 Tax=Streptomyces tirandamycinicus TaxID=2174846 RepID=A0A2S1T2B6_9ACTN|nr:hypothetical protein [Streptomyces tirandamycinicus]AWI32726.1 hypothetical protein DDW44_30910 [Streptomyces tirandamycinicus]
MRESTAAAVTAEKRVSDLLEESGVRDSLIPTYAKAFTALYAMEFAAQLRAEGFEEAAARLQPDPAVIEAAWGEE